MDWYYATNGQQGGPVDKDGLKALAQRGTLSPTDLVWNATMGNQWGPAESVPGLFETADPNTTQQNLARPFDSAPQGPMAENAELTARARRHMENHWGLAVGMILVYMLILSAVSSIPIVQMFINGAFILGLSGFFLAVARKEQTGFQMFFDGFYRFGTSLGAYLLMTVFVFLWSLLLIVPGMIATLAYSMTYFLLSDDDERELGALDAIRASKQMMDGHKLQLFLLNLRLLPWALLAVLTCGIGLLWFSPYSLACYAEFYEEIRHPGSTR